MKAISHLLPLLALLPLAAVAADFDGSKPLICATVEAHDCSSGQACTKGLAADFAAPTFVRIDVAKKVVVGPTRTTPIVMIEKSDKQIILLGTELDYAWSMALDKEDGTMSAAIVDRTGVFALFGNCTPL